jgi:hypothetical protein
LAANQCPDFLFGYTEELRPASFRWCAPEDLPEPCRSLLVHRRDMTSILERHHGEAMALEVLSERHAGDHSFREVILRGAESAEPFEVGLIEIEEAQFPENLREEILSGGWPLAGPLNESGMPYLSSPFGYFSVARNQLLAKLRSETQQ